MIVSIPSAYAEQYDKAYTYDPARIDNYIKHTAIGDPALDPVMDELALSLSPEELHRFVKAGIEQEDDVLHSAPQVLRDFFDNITTPPWLDFEEFRPGIRAFHINIDYILVAFMVAILVEGFSTLISKSFRITGRVGSGATTRRLQQNNRHLIESFYPGGLVREGDGWKVSARLRFVHARIRNLLKTSDEWDHDAWGLPVSAAHLGFAITVFSQRLLECSSLLGAIFSEEEKESFYKVWRYIGYVMGIPETILYTDAREAAKILRIGYLCEPSPSADSVAVANAFIQAVPKAANIEDPISQQKFVIWAYRISRSLIGDELADKLEFPGLSHRGVLFVYRLKQRFHHFLRSSQLIRSENFVRLLQISVYEDSGLSYKLPDNVHAAKQSEW